MTSQTLFPGTGFVCGLLVGASCLAQNTPPPPAPGNLPPDQANRLTLSLDEIRRASSSQREQERREQMLRLYEEAQRRKAALRKEQGDEPRADSLTKFNLKDFADENQKELGALATTYEEKKANRVELMMRRSFAPESYTSGSSEKHSKPSERTPTVIHAAPTQPKDTPPDTTLRDYTSTTTRRLQESGVTNSVVRPLSPTLTVSNRSFSIFNRPTKTEETAARTTPSAATGFRPALTTGSGAPGKGSYSATGVGATDTKYGTSAQTVPTSPLDVVKSSTAIAGPLDVVRSSLSGNRYVNPMMPYDPVALTTPANEKPSDGKSTKPGEAAGAQPAKSTSPYASYFQTPSLFRSLSLTPVLQQQQPGTPSPTGGNDQTLAGNQLYPAGTTQPNAGDPATANNTPAPGGGLGALLTPTQLGSPSLPSTPGGTLTPGSSTAPLTPGGLSFPSAGAFGSQPIGSFQPITPIQTTPRKGGIGPNGYYEPKSITDLQYGR